MTDEPLILGAPMSINHDTVTKDLVLKWMVLSKDPKGWMEPVAEVRIQPKEMLDFIAMVTREGMYCLRDVGTAIAWGDCDRCGNKRLIEVPGITEGSTKQVRCPECSSQESLPDGPPVAFADWPRYRKSAVREWCDDCVAWVQVREDGSHLVLHSDPDWDGQ
jgi:hypothetical protein